MCDGIDASRSAGLAHRNDVQTPSSIVRQQAPALHPPRHLLPNVWPHLEHRPDKPEAHRRILAITEIRVPLPLIFSTDKLGELASKAEMENRVRELLLVPRATPDSVLDMSKDEKVKVMFNLLVGCPQEAEDEVKRLVTPAAKNLPREAQITLVEKVSIGLLSPWMRRTSTMASWCLEFIEQTPPIADHADALVNLAQSSSSMGVDDATKLVALKEQLEPSKREEIHDLLTL